MKSDKKVILITGAPSGIGKATAVYFADRGRNVAATMRNPDAMVGFERYKNRILRALAVTFKDF